MSGHIHAELMAQYAKDARETDAPWKRWEFKNKHESLWRNLSTNPGWHKDDEYRRKPRTITINGREVPEPMREAPERGSVYYVVEVATGKMTRSDTWRGDDYDKRWLSRGLCHSTKEAAIAHAEALLSFTEAK